MLSEAIFHWVKEIENVNGEKSILIDYLMHYDWLDYKASEPDMNLKMKFVLASKEGIFSQIQLVSQR